jgi:hypothetical protein
MLKSIFIQLWNRKRSNLSLVAVLFCVFCIVWYISDYLFVYACNRNIRDGRDTNHTWRVELERFPPDHPSYRAEEDAPEACFDNFSRILRAIRNHPDVEAAGVINGTDMPGAGSYQGTSCARTDDTTHFVTGQIIRFSPADDFFRIFGYTRDGGRTAVSTDDFDWGDPQAIVISRSLERAMFPGGAKGQELTVHYGDDMRYRIAGVVDDIKRFDYRRPHHAYYLPMRVNAETFRDTRGKNPTIVIRSRATVADDVFNEKFMEEMDRMLQIGNFYPDGLTPCNRIKAEIQQLTGVTHDVHMRIYLTIFFVLNILLCVTGTFWYRVSLRRSEIGLRKALGAPKRDISRRFFLEGLCLLAVAAVAAAAVEFQFVRAGAIETLGKNATLPDVYLPDRTLLRFLITNTITAAVLSLAILAAVWMPARRAAQLPPAEVLKDE